MLLNLHGGNCGLITTTKVLLESGQRQCVCLELSLKISRYSLLFVLLGSNIKGFDYQPTGVVIIKLCQHLLP
jgi:hypothetical protein